MLVRVKHSEQVKNPVADKYKGKKDEYFGENYKLKMFDNGAIVGPTGSGKSIVIRHLLKHFIGPDTVVRLFCPTRDVCETWEETMKRLKKRKVTVEQFDSIYEPGGGSGKNRKSVLTKHLDEWRKDKKGELSDKNKKPELLGGAKINDKVKGAFENNISNKNSNAINLIEQLALDQEEKKLEEEGMEKKEKWPMSKGKVYCRYLYIFDDLSSELRALPLEAFLKECRHYGVNTIVSSQSWMDFGRPGQRNQTHWVCIMRSVPEKSILEIAKDLNVPVPTKTFLQIYKTLTEDAEKFPFMFCCPIKKDYRQYFTEYLNYDDLLGGKTSVGRREPEQALKSTKGKAPI